MESSKHNIRIWIFVIGINIIAFSGATYLKSNGIDLYAFRGGG